MQCSRTTLKTRRCRPVKHKTGSQVPLQWATTAVVNLSQFSRPDQKPVWLPPLLTIDVVLNMTLSLP